MYQSKLIEVQQKNSTKYVLSWPEITKMELKVKSLALQIGRSIQFNSNSFLICT